MRTDKRIKKYKSAIVTHQNTLNDLVSRKTTICLTDISNDYNEMIDALELIRCCVVPDEGGETFYLQGEVKHALNKIDQILNG